MRPRFVFALVALALVAAGVRGAPAQTPLRGELAVTFDPLGQSASRAVTNFDVFSTYLVVTGAGEMFGWEAGLDRPFTMTILSEVYSERGALTVGRYIVGLGACVDYSQPTALVSIAAGFFSSEPVGEELLCLGPSTPTSVDPPAPAFVDCADDVFALRLANTGRGAYPDGCAVLNPTQEPPVSTRSLSYGVWKARAEP